MRGANDSNEHRTSEMGRHRRHAVASSALVAALVAVAGVASVARGATPVVPSASSVRVVAGSRATLTLAGTDSDDTHTLSALITSLPGTGSVYKDDQNTALDAAANYCTALASGTVSARRLAGSQTAYFVAPCDETETRREFTTTITYRLIDSVGACSDESTITVTIEVYKDSVSRFVRACTAKWVSRTDVSTVDAVDWWDPTLTLPLTGTDAANNGQFKKLANSSAVVYGWGDNAMAQLAFGDTAPKSQPVTNANFELVKQFTYISASDKTVMGVEYGTGYVWGWGFDSSGVLNLETKTPDASSLAVNPVRIGALEGMTKVAVGVRHAVAVSASGHVFTWGNDDLGQLGRGWMPGTLQYVGSETFLKNKGLPTRVVNNGFGSVTAVEVAAGLAHTLVLTSTGSIWAWGSNIDGQLGLKPCEVSKYGDGTGACSAFPDAPEMPTTQSPQEVPSAVKFSAIAASARYSMAISAADANGANGGLVYTWGYGESGQLGFGTDGLDPFRSAAPKVLATLADAGVQAVFIAAGDFHAAAVASTGEVYTWGLNTFGQLGHNDRVSRFIPTKVTALADANVKIHWVSCGRSHTVAVSDYGEVFTWGSNEFGQLGLEPRPASDASYNLTLTLRGWQQTAISASRRRLLANYGTELQSGASSTLFYAFRDTLDASGRVGGSNAEFEALVMGATRPFKGGYLSTADVGLYGEVEYVAAPVIVAEVQQVTMVVAVGGFSLALRVSCDVGYERDTETGQCSACSAGGYTNDFTSFVCSPCPLGQYQNESASSSCILCESGTYAATTGLSVCSKCPAGTFVPFEGAFASSFCESCPAGSYSAAEGSSSCTPCGTGSYQVLTGQASCTGCPIGTFNGAVGAQRSSDCVSCPAGKFAASTGASQCEPCPAGTDASAPGASACDPCDIGFYSEGGAVECTPCPAGTTGDATATMSSVDDCVPCAVGTYTSDMGQSVCLSCPDGTYSATAGATECTKCPAGYSGVGTANVIVRDSLQNACQQCAVGTYTAVAGSTPTLVLGLNQFCTKCEAGTYQDQEGQTLCKSCPAGKVTATDGAVAEGDCVNCGTGKYAPHAGMGACLDCPPGRYGPADRTDTSECTTCPPGKYSINYASVSEDDCDVCPAGFYAADGEPCKECPAGQYQADAGEPTCDLCPKGTYLADTGATSVDQCLPCPLGTATNDLGSTVCVPCAAGSYSSTEGRETCEQCPAGTALATTGSVAKTDCEDCPLGSVSINEGSAACTLCGPGSYSDIAPGSGIPAESCKLCPAGSYSAAEGATSVSACTLCAVGTYNPADGQVDCLRCPAGTYGDEEGLLECKAAPAGYFLPGEGATSAVNLQPCPTGTYSDIEGLAECLNCVAGTYSNTTAATGCIDCVAGTYSIVEASPTVENCLECAIGQYSLDASVSCSDCEPGTYAGQTGMAICDGCPAGTYGTEQGGTSVATCIECAAGTYSDTEASQLCDPCPAGTYSDVTGLSTCKPCRPGTYGAIQGATTGDDTVCRPCPLGRASAGGKAACDACTPGTYASTLGLANCTLCPEGTYGVTSGATVVTLCERCPLYHFNSSAGSTSVEACVYYHSAARTGTFLIFFLVYAAFAALALDL